MKKIVTISSNWKTAFPNALAGALVLSNVTNSKNSQSLKKQRNKVESKLKSHFANKTRKDIKTLSIIQAYRRHYKKFNKSYHVRLQLESVIYKNKSTSNKDNLVEAMFIAELKNLILTAGHDLKPISLPVVFDVSTGEESFTSISGKEQRLKPKDMIMKDSKQVICSVIYGPDSRTRIKPDTQRVLFTVYAPAGITRKQVLSHLKDIQSNVLFFAPEAKTELIEVLGTLSPLLSPRR